MKIPSFLKLALRKSLHKGFSRSVFILAAYSVRRKLESVWSDWFQFLLTTSSELFCGRVSCSMLSFQAASGFVDRLMEKVSCYTHNPTHTQRKNWKKFLFIYWAVPSLTQAIAFCLLLQTRFSVPLELYTPQASSSAQH